MNGVIDPLSALSASTNADCRCLHVDPQWLEASGQSAAKSLGYGWIGAVHADNQSGMITAMRVAARSAGVGLGAELVVTSSVGAEPEAVNVAPANEVVAPPSALRLLVVDDDRDVADSMAMLLEIFGAEIRVAYDGVAGVEAAAEFKPDIAFVDIRMPGIDGYETARRVRARLRADSPKLVALSGLGQEKDRDHTMDSVFDLWLAKPVSVDVLENLLRR